MDKKISVVIKRPGMKPYHTYISPSLENLKNTVGGYIEAVTTEHGHVFILNEEGKIMGLPSNFRYGNDIFVGTVILCGVAGDDFGDLNLAFKDVKQLYPTMFQNI